MSVLKLKNEETQEFETILAISGAEGPKGENGEDGYSPVKGVDYFTEEDILELAQLLIEQLPAAEEEEF